MFSKFSHKFSEINDLELLREIEAVGTIKEFKHGDVLMEVGSYIKSTPLMLEGLTKIVKEDNIEDFSEAVIEVLCNQDFHEKNIQKLSLQNLWNSNKITLNFKR